jgi:hypothetical protein
LLLISVSKNFSGKVLTNKLYEIKDPQKHVPYEGFYNPPPFAFFAFMKKRKRKRLAPAPKLPEPDILCQLMIIGTGLKSHRQARTTLERLSYEIDLAKTTLINCEAGNDMFLSTFLKLLYGLGIPPEQFFKVLEK